MFTSAIEPRIGTHHERISTLFNHRREGVLEFVVRSGEHYGSPQAHM
jgi:hypothetical protein